MRRTKLNLDDELLAARRTRASREKTTASELVHQAVRERYPGDREQRRVAMEQFIGIRKSSATEPTSTEQVRRLRRGSRLKRLSER